MINQRQEIKESEYYPEGFKDLKEYNSYLGFDFDFTVQRFTYTYYSTLDIIAALGGIGATVKLMLESAAPLLVLKFMYEFANMMTRKSIQKLRIFKIREIYKNFAEMKKVIVKKLMTIKDEAE